ncbi:integrin beta pat-3-like isoform X2 [Plodia interpunctella]|uniref:integrin beta pat-3-like isoform X2 n=1 Tax=Plodia interpunctella TaxID=58824 RepID=UPI00236866FA|nr:integrin beta pat-3-like isoform X2 [Plodia interpunctella]
MQEFLAVMTGRRCVSLAEISSHKFDCQEKHRIYPTTEVKVSRPDLNSNDFRGGEDGIKKDAVQFVPHNLDITTRPGTVVNFDMYYKPAKDFPIDVYYLMDHSFTMIQHTATLQQEGKNLYNELKSFTNNVRFGIGSFVEKPALPYADPHRHVAYSFRNHLSLTDEIEQFVKVLKDVPFGANYEDPEAGLDALMQVMACEPELNWRKGARRIIVLCTDGTYHSAGDGKMVGADLTNDMKCHLKGNSYDAELTFDYPSVSQINKVATDGKFIIIFAAVENIHEDYIALANAIHGAKYVELKRKSNIIEIIRNAYLESTRVMKLSLDPNWPLNVKLSLNPDCLKTEDCKVVHNQILQIQANLTVSSCDGPRKPVLKIGPANLMESLSIKLNVLCECDCEKGPQKNNSKECSSNGSYQCGVCKCNEGRSGSSCQCSGENAGISESHKCKANETDLHFCSSHGTCNCGKCDCNDDFSGNFCEFDDKSCVRVNNQLCGGHGRCHLGKCHCTQNWEGDDCSCSAEVSGCINPYTNNICSGKGKCVCGECVCEKESKQKESHGGAFCDSCEECSERRCQELETQVHCTYYHTTCNKDYDAVVDVVNRTEINSKQRQGEWCKKTLENGTWIVFRHYYDHTDRKIHVIIQDQLEAPPKADIWVPVGIALGTVLLIGLLTVIIWKILVDYYDAKEYEKFAREAQDAGYEITKNPFYIQPGTQFSNPAFQQ